MDPTDEPMIAMGASGPAEPPVTMVRPLAASVSSPSVCFNRPAALISESMTEDNPCSSDCAWPNAHRTTLTINPPMAGTRGKKKIQRPVRSNRSTTGLK